MKVCLEMQSICLRFAGIEKSELFIPPERVIIHLKAPPTCETWFVASGSSRGEKRKGGQTGRLVCKSNHSCSQIGLR